MTEAPRKPVDPVAPWAALPSIETLDIETRPPSISTPPPTPEPVGSISPPVSFASPPLIVRSWKNTVRLLTFWPFMPEDLEIPALFRRP